MKISDKDILFIVPEFFFIEPHQEDLYYGDIPLGVLQIISFLENKTDINCHIIDLRVESLEFSNLRGTNPERSRYEDSLLKILQKIGFNNLAYIAISCYTSYQYFQTKLIGDILKKYFKENNLDIKIIVGGYHPTAVPEDFSYKNSPFDFIIQGEAELPLLNIIKNKKNLTRVLSCREGIDINDLPLPAYKKYLARYAPFVDLRFEFYASRGCPYQCAFCGLNFPLRSLKFKVFKNNFIQFLKIVEDHYKKYTNTRKKPKIAFADQSFNRIEIFIDILKYIKSEGLNEKYQFSCQCRIEGMTPDLIRLFRECNFIIGFGFESANSEMLVTMKKTTNSEKYIQNMKDILKIYKNEEGPYCRINILHGFPGETHKKFMETIHFIEKYAVHPRIQISPTLFSIYPNVPAYQEINNLSLRYGAQFNKDWWQENSNVFKLSILHKPSENYDLSQLLIDYRNTYSQILRFFIKENLDSLFNNNVIGAFSSIKLWENFYDRWIAELKGYIKN